LDHRPANGYYFHCENLRKKKKKKGKMEAAVADTGIISGARLNSSTNYASKMQLNPEVSRLFYATIGCHAHHLAKMH
jgi:hypothetical protein